MEFRLLSYVKESAAPRAGLLVEGQTVLDVERVLTALGTEVGGLCPTSVLSILRFPRGKDQGDVAYFLNIG